MLHQIMKQVPSPHLEHRTYNTSGKYLFELITVQGNIANFSYRSNAQRSAIVTSTTEDCMGGICTGVSGAVTISGGLNLLDDRHKLPTTSHSTNSRNSRPIRCPKGSAVITGPNNSYGGLKVPFVIHTVGGFDNETSESAYLSVLNVPNGIILRQLLSAWFQVTITLAQEQ